jgi:23S rRNA (uracil1939-C5)-methyltransferase
MLKSALMIELQIEKLNHKGYGVSKKDGIEYWVLNSLPGEVVNAEIFKKKKGIRIGKSVNIISQSQYRVEPSDLEIYQSTSPWQILDFAEESVQKKLLIQSFYHEVNVSIPDFEIKTDGREWKYRNKMEYSFYIDETNYIHLAFHKRDSRRGKAIVDTSSLVNDIFNSTAKDFEKHLNQSSIEIAQLKCVVVRSSNFEDKCIIALALKDKATKIDLKFWAQLLDKSYIKGVIFVYSDPRSPAFVETEILNQIGETDLVESIAGKEFQYNYSGFFQVNPPMFDLILSDMKTIIGDRYLDKVLLDIYAGVGSIGISLSDNFRGVTGVELHPQSEEYALMNAKSNSIANYSFKQGYAEKVLSSSDFDRDSLVLLDPPRSGLHPKIIKSLHQNGPEEILYMSCNPFTQAKDIEQLSGKYNVEEFNSYNFYPKTPHVESLALLKRAI